MKKKANAVLIAIFLFFLCFIFGLLIGRHTASGHVFLNDKNASSIRSESLSNNSITESDDFGKIDINTASAMLLQSLPNIGETLSNRIVAYREENGPFSSVDDLLMVKGIGQSKLDEIRQYITAGG